MFGLLRATQLILGTVGGVGAEKVVMMQTDKAQERITELETELKTMQDNYNQAAQVMENCKVRIIAIQASIAERKLDLPEESKIEETVATG